MTTQLSQYGGLDNPDDIHIDNLSVAEDSDDENRDNEIRKLLEEGLSNVTFDYDSDDGSSNLDRSKISNHNDCSFISTKDTPNSTHIGDGDICDAGIFQAPKINGSDTIDGNSKNDTPTGYNGIGNGKLNGILKNGYGSHKEPAGGTGDTPEEHSVVSNDVRNVGQSTTAPNPSGSLIHAQHCPRGENDGLNTGIWLSAENNVEQLKALCEFRERQIQRGEETIATLQKDKRALNHQIGLMKSEMVHMKSQIQDSEKFIGVKEEESKYLQAKIREAIEEYEIAKSEANAAKQQCSVYEDEIQQLRQEIHLLSNLGSTTQQAEVNDVVRQLREKHAQDMAGWQKVVAALEGEVKTLRRSQQLLHEDSMIGSKHDACVQTDDEIESFDKEFAAQEFKDEFYGDAFLEELGNLPESDLLQRVRKEWRAERSKLVQHYKREIQIYQDKLIALPKQLYERFRRNEEELGISTVTKHTMDKSTNTGPEQIAVTKKDASVECEILVINQPTPDEQRNNDMVKEPEFRERQVDMVSVTVQTEETLQTYLMLASLIDEWKQEVDSCKERAETAERNNIAAENELKSLNKKFRDLQKLVSFCRKEWKKQEESLKEKNAQQKAHYIAMLKNLNAKLAMIDDST